MYMYFYGDKSKGRGDRDVKIRFGILCEPSAETFRFLTYYIFSLSKCDLEHCLKVLKLIHLKGIEVTRASCSKLTMSLVNISLKL